MTNLRCFFYLRNMDNVNILKVAEVLVGFICTFAAAVTKRSRAACAVKQVVNLFNNIVIAGLTRRQRLWGGVKWSCGS